MARRSKTSLENDIERSRWEEKWEHVQKLVEQLSSRTTSESSIGKSGEFILILYKNAFKKFLNTGLGATACAENEGQFLSIYKYI